MFCFILDFYGVLRYNINVVTIYVDGRSPVMTRDRYFEVANEKFANGSISEEVFWAMIDNADEFCEDEED